MFTFKKSKNIFVLTMMAVGISSFSCVFARKTSHRKTAAPSILTNISGCRTLNVSRCSSGDLKKSVSEFVKGDYKGICYIKYAEANFGKKREGNKKQKVIEALNSAEGVRILAQDNEEDRNTKLRINIT